MAQSDIHKMLEFAEKNKPSQKKRMKFDSGTTAGIYSRGSIPLMEWKVLLSLHVSWLQRVLTHLIL